MVPVLKKTFITSSETNYEVWPYVVHTTKNTKNTKNTNMEYMPYAIDAIRLRKLVHSVWEK